MKIGIFDSGMGGLSVLKEIDKTFKGNEIIYLADTKRLPYGDKTKEEIIKYTNEILKFLVNKKVDILIVACNTINAIAYEEVLKYNIKTYGILNCGIKMLDNTKYDDVLILATKATVKSNKYSSIKNNKNILQKSMTGLVELIENEDSEGIDRYLLDNLKNISNKSIILGCTHYPFIIENLKKNFSNIEILNPAKQMVKELEELLKKDGLDNTYEFYTTSNANEFAKKASKIIGKEIQCLNISLED